MKSSSLRRFAAGLLFTVVAASFLMALPVRQKAASGYHLIKTVSLPPAPGGDEYYDYLTVDADAGAYTCRMAPRLSFSTPTIIP